MVHCCLKNGALQLFLPGPDTRNPKIQPMVMFRRQTRDPFPVRNIIALSVIVLLVLLYVLRQLKKAEQAGQEPIRMEQGK